MTEQMERINRILRHPVYRECVAKNEAAERDRIFCRHNMGHFTDVARIGQIINLEEGYGISTELIYAAALVHDIGRFVQYEDQTPHEKASAVLAPQILAQSGFDNKETDVIIDAVLHHRDESIKEEHNLRGVLYRADKLSRACYACKAEPMCDWKKEKKNLTMIR
ncbi:MAG: HD domain-containing protein [Lachnospiraceae bacterium]